MIKRAITASVLIACMVGIFFLREVSVLFFDALLTLVMVAGMLEVAGAFKKIGKNVRAIYLIVYATLFLVGFYLMGASGVLYALILSAVVLLTGFTFSKDFSLADLGATAFTMLYPSVFLYLAFEINHLANGLLIILLVLLIAVFTDTFAYFVGSLLKGKKLCPTISPKKTVSGAIGGLIGGMIGAIIIYLLFEVWNVFGVSGNTLDVGELAFLVYCALGLIGAVADEIGDLVASQIKRKSGIKDFGNIFPGHGGIMDRIDGISFVLAIIPLCIMFI